MRVNNVVGFVKGNTSRGLTFNRKLREDEKKPYSETLNRALDYLGVQNRALIIHGSSFPAKLSSGEDQKIGTPYGQEEFLDFIKLHGFNSVQLGPDGKLNRKDTSPYTSSAFAKNPLFIDFTQLKSDEYVSILSDDEIDREASDIEIPNENYTYTDFDEANAISNTLLSAAWNNFQNKLNQGDNNAIRLNEEYQRFQQENSYWLNDYAVLDSIAKTYGTDHYPNWSQEDRELLKRVKQGDNNARNRYWQILNEDDNSNIYKFSQFLVDKQAKADLRARNITFIGDLLVGGSSFDELANEDIFLKGYKLGCDNGGPFNSPQTWGMSIVDPNKLFNKDGSLGPSGRYLKAKLEKALSNSSNIRIDHAIGLVNPYLYKEDTVVKAKKRDEHGMEKEYTIREKLHSGHLSELGIDRNHNFEKVLNRIVLPTMREHGIDPHKVVWEDLGWDRTGVFNKVFRDQEHLNGISGLMWVKSYEAPKDNWAYIGCHDNPPVQQMMHDSSVTSNEPWKLDYLAYSMYPAKYQGHEREQFKTRIKSNPREYINAKFADLLRSTKNIQISFMDFFGINKTYNQPGTVGNENWTLRLNPNYKDTYYKSLSHNDAALNMPEIVSMAVNAKVNDDIQYGKASYNKKHEIQPMINELNHWAGVLKEPE